MKKLLLGLGAVSIAALPVLAVVSCSDEASTTDLKITVKKEVSLELVKAADTAYKAAAEDEAKKIEALKPIFEGINAENFKNFEVATSQENITLTAKSGFSFAGKTTLEAITITDLKITVKKEVSLELVKAADTAYKAAAEDEAKKIEALKPIFEGINADNFKNFDVVTTEAKITLTAKSGFSFAGKTTLEVAPVAPTK